MPLISRRVAAASAVATLLVCLFGAPLAPAEAAVRVFGLGDWLEGAAERSLNAVYEHIPATDSDAGKERLLRVVTNRLLAGYLVTDVRLADGEVSVYLERQSDAPNWSVALIRPNLGAPADEWFVADTSGLEEELSGRMTGVPIESLAWGDAELKRVVESACAERLPGWRVSLMVRRLEEDSAALEVSFTPEQPLVLAVSSRISSTTIPAMLYSSLKEDLTKGFAPVIGVPVVWLERHESDFAAMGKGILENENLVEQGRIEPVVEAKAGSVSEVGVDLESRRYTAWVWMAVYAGAEGKYPEAGLHFGRRAELIDGWTTELYVELISSLENFNLESRLGMRWSPLKNFWIGGEWSHTDDLWWLRASFVSRVKPPYGWLRLSEEGDTNAAFGLRINDFFSIELHYDSRDSDPWNIRALVNL